MALLQSACKRLRVSCSPLLAVADLEAAFKKSWGSISGDAAAFLARYSQSTFKTSPTMVLGSWLQDESFWSPLLELLPDATLPTVKGRQALQACHAAKPLASEQYLASLTLSVLLDRILSTCRVQLTKFRELASDSSSYAAVSRRCTVEELGALNRLLALTSSNLTKSSDPAATVTKPAELDHQQALVPFQAASPEPALPAEMVLPPATSSDTATLQLQPASCSFRRLVTFDQLFGCDPEASFARPPARLAHNSSLASCSSQKGLSFREREALQLALDVDPLDAATKRALKKQRSGRSTAGAAKATAAATAKPPSVQQSTKPKPKPLTVAKNPAAARKLQPAKPAPAVKKTGRKNKVESQEEKRRQRKNFASRKYHQARDLPVGLS